MFILDKDQAKIILISELGYQPFEADSFLKDFPSIHDELEDAIVRWLKDRTVTDVTVEGITIKETMQSQGYNFLLALKEMNRLLDDDLSSADRLRLANILRKPAIHR